jgi:hypothetical protein
VFCESALSEFYNLCVDMNGEGKTADETLDAALQRLPDLAPENIKMSVRSLFNGTDEWEKHIAVAVQVKAMGLS